MSEISKEEITEVQETIASTTSIPTTMKAAVYREFGDPEKVLRIENDFFTPKPTTDQLLIRVEATSINPVDWKRMKGLLGFISTKLPFVPCEDIAGTVIQIGENCKRFKVGDKVMAKSSPKDGGAMAEYCTVTEEMATLKPNNLTSFEAASFPLAGMTALQALKKGKIKEGMKVLILGGSGGVGYHAVQIAKHYNTFVVATCGTQNIDWVRSLGADEVIDYKSQDWSMLLKGKDFDIIFDTVGGGWQGARHVAKSGGTFVTIVGDDPHQPKVTMQELAINVAKIAYRKVASVTGGPHYVFFITKDKRGSLEEIAKMANVGALRPYVDKVYPLPEALQAFNHNMEGHTKGKVVVSISNFLSQQAL